MVDVRTNTGINSIDGGKAHRNEGNFSEGFNRNQTFVYFQIFFAYEAFHIDVSVTTSFHCSYNHFITRLKSFRTKILFRCFVLVQLSFYTILKASLTGFG